MGETNIHLPAWAQAIIYLVLIGYAGFERVRAARLGSKNQLTVAKDELISVLTADRDAWKQRYEAEHEEARKDRQAKHDIIGEIGVKVTKLTAENAELRVKTDLTPLMQHQEKMGQVLSKAVDMLDRIAERMDHLMKGGA